MNLPETCPFCGSAPYVMADGKPCRGGDSWVLFCCDTALHAGQDIRRTQSRKCEGLERTRLADRILALEAENKALREDEAWALDSAVTVHPVMGAESFAPTGWSVRYWDGVRTLEESAPTIHAALRALRAKVEGGTR